jgi:hypothetical protein
VTVRAENGELVIRLSPEEGAKIQVDHGEAELVIPIEDSVATILAINGALAELPAAGGAQ